LTTTIGALAWAMISIGANSLQAPTTEAELNFQWFTSCSTKREKTSVYPRNTALITY